MLRPAPLLLLLTACTADPVMPSASPLELAKGAYEAAGDLRLPDRAAEDWPDLENVFHLSEQVHSGGEPLGDRAFARLAAWGVRTVISVDGSAPDHGSARAHGMQTVHIPIQYRGLSNQNVTELVKTFRELEGPFYVHCFHGRHRGPAAAAIGRIVLDGASREQVIAEMRQWCGTSPSYEGLFRCVATTAIPSGATTAEAPFDFPAAATPDNLQSWMASITRSYEYLESRASAGFTSDPAHPDLDPTREARRVSQGFEACLALEEVRSGSPDHLRQMRGALASSKALLAAIEAGDPVRADGALGTLSGNCSACHRAYRNN